MKKILLTTLALIAIPLSSFAYTGSWGFNSTSTPNYYPLSVFGNMPAVWADHFVGTSTTASSIFPNASTTNLTVSGNSYFPSGIWNSSGNVGIGTPSPGYKLDIAGDINVNATSSYKYDGLNMYIGSTALYNSFVGGAGNTTVTGNYNTGIGRQSLINLTTGTKNIGLGVNSLFSMTSGTGNMAIGLNTMFSHTTGNSNVAIGFESLKNGTSGNYNIGVGGNTLTNTYSDKNTGIGFFAGTNITTGSTNTLIGYDAGGNITTGGSNTIIGGYVLAASTTDSGQLNIGNVIYGTGFYSGSTPSSAAVSGNVGIGTTTPATTLSVVGTTTTTGLNVTGSDTSTFAGSIQATAGTILNNEYTPATSTSMTLAWTNGNQQLVKLGHAAVTINFSGVSNGGVLRLPLCQDATGGATVTWDSRILWASSTPPTLSGANHCDLITLDATAGTSTQIIFGGYINF